MTAASLAWADSFFTTSATQENSQGGFKDQVFNWRKKKKTEYFLPIPTIVFSLWWILHYLSSTSNPRSFFRLWLRAELMCFCCRHSFIKLYLKTKHWRSEDFPSSQAIIGYPKALAPPSGAANAPKIIFKCSMSVNNTFNIGYLAEFNWGTFQRWGSVKEMC